MEKVEVALDNFAEAFHNSTRNLQVSLNKYRQTLDFFMLALLVLLSLKFAKYITDHVYRSTGPEKISTFVVTSILFFLLLAGTLRLI